jgi:hypothetical protein
MHTAAVQRAAAQQWYERHHYGRSGSLNSRRVVWVELADGGPLGVVDSAQVRAEHPEGAAADS